MIFSFRKILVVLLFFALPNSSVHSLTVATSGGYVLEVRNELLFPSLLAKYDDLKLDVRSDGEMIFPILRLQQERGVALVDLVDTMVEGMVFESDSEMLNEEIDLDGFIFKDKLNLGKCQWRSRLWQGKVPAIPVMMYGFMVVESHHTNSRTKGGEGKMADFFDLDKVKGKRAMFLNPLGALELALLADGVLPEHVYQVLSKKEGLDRAFAILGRLKGHLIFSPSFQALNDMLISGETAMIITVSTRISQLLENDIDKYTVYRDRYFTLPGYLFLSKSSANRKAAYQYIEHSLEPERYAAFLKKMGAAPVCEAVKSYFSQEDYRYIPNEIEDGVVMYDAPFWSEHMDEIINRWEVFKQSMG